MQREIKFRGKTSICQHVIAKDVWIYGYYLIDEEFSMIRVENERKNYLVMPETVGQFTGLKDKNGKEIYEGDIVKVFSRSKSIIGKVIYEYSGFTIDVMNNNLEYGRTSIIERFTEIIGNTTDNPELLEV